MYTSDFAASTVRLNASTVEMSGRGVPSRTATPMAVRAKSARVSATTSRFAASCSSTVSVTMTTSVTSPASTFCLSSPAVPEVMTQDGEHGLPW